MLEFYGEPQSTTLRAVVVKLDDRVAGIIGLSRSASAVQLFSEHRAELVPHLSSITVWRAVKAALRMVSECPCAVYARSSDPAMMRRVGFHEVADGVWRN